ncbi:MAG: hypothetical protein E4H36_06140 [Spirochaetales bacterium]|nr:MAG: hypothetical protein E4H36_06140 [Spirochaetales bacterium]
MEKSEKGRAKKDRVLKAFRHEEPDRIPIHEFYWTEFLKQWRAELGLAKDTDPYRYYDLDLIVVMPNLDPVVRPFEILNHTESETLVKTGFGAIVRKVHDFPMPHYSGFETDTIEKVESFVFGDPWDDRRFFSAGDDHLNGVGDGEILRNTPAFMERLESWYPDFTVFGTVIEASEFMVRSIGQENMLLWMAMYPEAMGRFAEKINRFALEITRSQIKAAGGKLDGIFLAGDVAYANGMLFSPSYWRKYFKPGVKVICEEAHANGLPVFYHGCGDVSAIFEDLIEAGVDAYHPLEAKANLDMLALRKKLGHRLAFFGNMDVRVWGRGDREEIKTYTLRKLNAAKGGGYVFCSDHSVPASVPGSVYDYLISLVRKSGVYPLALGEYDIPD